MLLPKRVKHRKQQRGRMTGAPRAAPCHFGEYGLRRWSPGWVTNRQIEAARIAMTRYIKRGGKVWINIFPDKPITKKPAETRMGNGKGNPILGGRGQAGPVMFELAGVSDRMAREAMRLAAHKLPIKMQVRDQGGWNGE